MSWEGHFTIEDSLKCLTLKTMDTQESLWEKKVCLFHSSYFDNFVSENPFCQQRLYIFLELPSPFILSLFRRLLLYWTCSLGECLVLLWELKVSPWLPVSTFRVTASTVLMTSTLSSPSPTLYFVSGILFFLKKRCAKVYEWVKTFKDDKKEFLKKRRLLFLFSLQYQGGQHNTRRINILS